jgi:hypothetical protein
VQRQDARCLVTWGRPRAGAAWRVGAGRETNGTREALPHERCGPATAGAMLLGLMERCEWVDACGAPRGRSTRAEYGYGHHERDGNHGGQVISIDAEQQPLPADASHEPRPLHRSSRDDDARRQGGSGAQDHTYGAGADHIRLAAARSVRQLRHADSKGKGDHGLPEKR